MRRLCLWTARTSRSVLHGHPAVTGWDRQTWRIHFRSQGRAWACCPQGDQVVGEQLAGEHASPPTPTDCHHLPVTRAASAPSSSHYYIPHITSQSDKENKRVKHQPLTKDNKHAKPYSASPPSSSQKAPSNSPPPTPAPASRIANHTPPAPAHSSPD